MTADQAALPNRRVARFLAGGTKLSLTAALAGGAGLTLVVLGSIAVVLARGATPVESLIRTLRSAELAGVLTAGIASGVLGAALGLGSYRRMPTKIAREQAVGGAVLGAQAAVFGVVFLLFTRGNITKLATNFLDFRLIGPHLGEFANGAKNTIVLALAGQAIGMTLGVVLAVFAISKRAVVRAPARAYINAFRGSPLILQITFIYFGLAIGFGLSLSAYTAAILAFGLNTGAYSAEVFRAGIQSIERGQLEAARGLGMSYLQAMRYAILPQAFRRVIPPLMNEFVMLIKDTSLVIVLGLTSGERELFKVGRDAFSLTFNATFFLATALGYLIVCLPLIRLVTALERRLRSGLVGVVGATGP